MCPGHCPYRALVALEGLGQAVLVAVNLEDLDRLVGGTCRETSAVVVEHGIVLVRRALVSTGSPVGVRGGGITASRVVAAATYNHIIVARVGDDLGLGGHVSWIERCKNSALGSK